MGNMSKEKGYPTYIMLLLGAKNNVWISMDNVDIDKILRFCINKTSSSPNLMNSQNNKMYSEKKTHTVINPAALL